MATLGEEVGLRQVRKYELDALKQRLARHLPHSLAVYGAASLAARYGLHSLWPASILVPTCPRPSCLTVMAPITSSAMQCLVVFWSLEEHTAKDVTDRLSRLPHLDWNQRVIMFSVPTVLLPSVNLEGLPHSCGGPPLLPVPRVYFQEEPSGLGTEF
ncbi:hypothetical protein GWK47_034679 [Chionoecetes opilio]|uniref:Uncharacterized protein n=1 Tax=Chionoecetes opilio TaxID=41210 RepID=A0A8J4YUM9_CHIOP|nr:hypothetical protein GWK47_034679 [Chionoecetes opilio]